MKPHEEIWGVAFPAATLTRFDENDRPVEGLAVPWRTIGGKDPTDLDGKRMILAAAAPEMARVLLSLEIAGIVHGNTMCCPSCGGAEPYTDGRPTHLDSCELLNALRSAGVR